MLPVLSKTLPIFEYVRDERGRPTGETRDQLACNPSRNFTVTAKMDGTCCYIKNGEIFARQDIKKDISNAPPNWFPTAGTEPDRGGHIIGFRPLELKRGDKWHIKALCADDPTKATFLEYNADTKEFYYTTRSISDFNEQTAELLGPSVNGNKHNLRRHCYSVHGSIIVDAPWKSHENLKDWLATEGIIYEGIVIHDLDQKRLYKCHRGHLGGSHIWCGHPLPIKIE